jgi:hypothetical protein
MAPRGGCEATQRSRIVIFGYTEAQIAGFFLTYGVGAFILFMVFIIGHLAWESKAGRFGTFVIFLGLGVGFLGFLAKYVIQWWLEKR